MDHDLLIWCILVGVCASFIIFVPIIMLIERNKQNTAQQKCEDNTPIEPEYTTVTIKATVIDQACWVKTIGTKIPKTVKEFLIVFKTETDEILKLNVSEEMYDCFEQGQTGILTIVDGELYGFELAETNSAV